MTVQDGSLLPAARFGAEGAPVTFYVVRHGQTLFNVMGKVQGWCDTPLTDEGVRAAQSLGRGLAEVDFSAAYSNDSGAPNPASSVACSSSPGSPSRSP